MNWSPDSGETARSSVSFSEPPLQGEADSVALGSREASVAARPPDRFLAEMAFQRLGHRIQRRNHRQAERPAVLLQPLAGFRIDQGEQHQARIGSQFGQDPVEMLLRAHHRPEVADDFGSLELRERRLGDHLERFAGGIRQEVEVEPAHGARSGPFRGLWTIPGINHGRSRGTSSAEDSVTTTGRSIGKI